jgi:hypothetical protein
MSSPEYFSVVSEKLKYFFTGFKRARVVDPVSRCLLSTLWAGC